MNISHLKKQAKALQKLYPDLVAAHGQRLSLTAAQAVIAQLNGFPGWEQLIESTEGVSRADSSSKQGRAQPSMSLPDAIEAAMELVIWGPDELTTAWDAEAGHPSKTSEGFEGRFEYRTQAIRDRLDRVMERVDDVLDELTGGTGEYEVIPARSRKILIEDFEPILRANPGYIDGHAERAGLLHANEEYGVALQALEPVARHLLGMIDEVEKSLPKKMPFQLSYYELQNRPFHRLMHVYVLCLWEVGRGRDAKRICKRMLKLHPMDNIGFRFLVDGLGEDD